jgi:hypothetical protein
VGALNDGFRFLLELAGLVALGYWGFTVGGSGTRWLFGLGAPAAMAVVWGLFISPKAPMRTTDPVRILVELAVFGCAVAALVHAGRPKLALVLGAAVAVHLALTFPLDQR